MCLLSQGVIGLPGEPGQPGSVGASVSIALCLTLCVTPSGVVSVFASAVLVCVCIFPVSML